MRMSSILSGQRAGMVRTERAMRSATTNNHLAAFNRQVMEWQEAAYTLAYYLTGNEAQAEETVQGAVLQAYQKSGANPNGGRAALLQAVIGTCRKLHHAAHANGKDGLAGILSNLSPERRCAVLLVDVLGLSYEEAAQVLSSSPARVSEWLAQGRVAVMVGA